MDQHAQTIPGTIIWIAPFYNRSGFGVGARTNVIALHKAGARMKVVSVNQVESGIDDCDLALIKSLEDTPVIPPVTAIISHVPSRNWLNLKLPEPNVRILATTVFDCCAEDGSPPMEMLAVCREMDQIWLHVAGEREAFISAGFPPEMVQTVFWPHQWLENEAIPPPFPERPNTNKPFRFLNISLFLPRRRWDTLIEAYLEEFRGCEDVELYLKVNYPSWHPVPGKPRQDLFDLVTLLRRKAVSEESIIIDEELGTRRDIVRLIDSCNAYISTDTAATAPISEARVRQRMVVMPEGLLDNAADWYVGIPVDPQEKVPLTPDMLLYQPNHRGSSMPMLHIKDVREAMRRAYDMSPHERRIRASKGGHLLGPAQTVPIMVNAIRDAWQYKETRKKYSCPGGEVTRISWEGSQFVCHSLALVNRELCLQLIDSGHEVSIIPYEKDDINPNADPRFMKLAERTNRPLSGNPDIHIHHQWPPNFIPPKQGHWVMIQPWEYGSLPKDWIGPMTGLVDEIWVPSHFVQSGFLKSGVPEDRVYVIPNGVNTNQFRPDAKPSWVRTQKKYRFLFVGGTIWRKGPDVLLSAYLDAFKATGDVCLVIKDMGGHNIYKGQTFGDKIKRYLENPEFPEIEYLDSYISLEDMPGLYTSCHCLVHPYRGEGFGLPIAEAMACGLPVIVTGYGAACDFCREDRGYFIRAEEKRFEQKKVGSIETVDYPWYAEPDGSDLARLMRHVYENPYEAQEKGKRGRLYIENNLTWEHVRQKVVERMNERKKYPVKRFLTKTFSDVSQDDSLRISREGRRIKEEHIPDKHAHKSIAVSIIILLSNKNNWLKKCVQSIKRYSDVPYEFLFVGNEISLKKAKKIKAMVEGGPNDHLVTCKTGTGMAACYNAGIRASSGEYVVIIHNDILVSEGWLSGMVECLKKDPAIGVVVPMTNAACGIQKDDSADYQSIDHFHEYAKSFRKRNRHRLISTKDVAAYCFAFRRNLFEEVGPFDEKIMSEEAAIKDLCLRVKLEGYKNTIVSDVIIHHYNTHKVEAGKNRNPIASDKRYLLEKTLAMSTQGLVGKKFFALNAVEQAEKLREKDQIKDAFNVLIDAVRKVPDEKRIYYSLSEILIDARQYKDALEVLESMPSDDREIRRLELMGYCKEGMELYDGAEKCAEKVLAVNPSSASTFNLKGMLAYRKGEETTAEDWFNRSIVSDPSYGEPYANLGFMRWAAGKQNEALEYFEKAFILTPAVADIFTNYHAAIKALGECKRAETVFRDACALFPLNKRLKYLFIDILIQAGNHAAAMNVIQEAMIEFGMDDGVISAALEVRKHLGAAEIDKASVRKATVSLCMIVKNEEHNLGKCLMNMKPVVDEMIVVDTGSTDRTKDIAAIFGARVYDFTWTNDFSEARNFSISRASGDWIFVMDADEIISPSDYEAFERVLTKKSSSWHAAYSFVTRNYNMRSDIIGLNSNDGRYGDEEAGVGWIPSEKVRLFKNDGHIRFEYPVHEIVEPFLKRNGIEIKKCSIPIHHYGQMREDKWACKGEDYYRIGKQKLEEMGDNDIVAVYELAVQAGMLEKWEEAIELWQKVINKNPNVALAYVNMATAFQKLGNYDRAIQSVRKAMALDPDMKEAPNDYGLYLLYQGKAKEAVGVLEDVIRRFPEYLSAQFKLGVAYFCDCRNDEGREVFRKLGRTELGPGLAVSCHTIADKFYSLKMPDYAGAVLEGAIETGNGGKELSDLLDECRSARERRIPIAEEAYGMREVMLDA